MNLPEEELKQCLYSIGDNNAYLHQARDPADKMIAFLIEHFPADDPTEATSLAIAGGKAGARLTHDHKKQYAFVMQSLTLWREIANDMFRLWYATRVSFTRPHRCGSLGASPLGASPLGASPLGASRLSGTACFTFWLTSISVCLTGTSLLLALFSSFIARCSVFRLLTAQVPGRGRPAPPG